MEQSITNFFLMMIPLIIAVVAHEVAHGWSAYLLGDRTAKDAGRLSLNPLKHIDPVGSVLIPVVLKLTGAPFLFGYAKPVPVNFLRLKNFRAGTVIVALSGPLSNIALLIISGILFRFFVSPGTGLTNLDKLLFFSCSINAILAAFNMIPIPPLDGSKIIFAFISEKYRLKYARLERFGMIIIIFLIIYGGLDSLFTFFVKPLLEISTGLDLG